MKQNAILFLIGGIILAVLLAGCTAPLGTMPPATTPATPAPMTPVVIATEHSSPLSGTWTLISALGGRGTSNVLPGTTITATFAEDGTISGSGGCNNYVASCQSGVNTLSIGTLITTLKTCDSPAGIMNQEQIYLMNLQAACQIYDYWGYPLDLGCQRKDHPHLPERRSSKGLPALCRHVMGTDEVQK